jgi:hypothetical protein
MQSLIICAEDILTGKRFRRLRLQAGTAAGAQHNKYNPFTGAAEAGLQPPKSHIRVKFDGYAKIITGNKESKTEFGKSSSRITASPDRLYCAHRAASYALSKARRHILKWT